MRIRNQANTTTLFQFSDADQVNTGTGHAVILNEQSFAETFSFETQLKPRYGQKGIVKRQVGAINREFPLRILILGSSRDTKLAELRSVLTTNEFLYFDTESYLTSLDGVYAPVGTWRQKKDEWENTITVDVRLVEKET
jgi:hypothetical protein